MSSNRSETSSYSDKEGKKGDKKKKIKKSSSRTDSKSTGEVDIDKEKDGPGEMSEEKSKKDPTCGSSMRALFLANWYINIMLICVPAGIVLGILQVSNTATFVVNFLAIIPLAKMLGDCTEEIAFRVGQVVGGLLNATFGNAVELILAIFALKAGLIHVIQSSLLGSILSNLLLVLGMCFVFGGAKFKEQSFNPVASQTGGSILLVACFGVIIPAALNAQLTTQFDVNVLNLTIGETFPEFLNYTYLLGLQAKLTTDLTTERLLVISRGTAIILLIIYGLYLLFQLYTHSDLFAEGEDEEEEEPQVLLPVAIIGLLIVTILVGICSEFLVGGIEGIVQSWDISEAFVGLILLPIVGNAAEHLTAVSCAFKNKMDLAIGVAVGSSVQIALLVTPLLVVLGWIVDKPMTLHFDLFETSIMFISVIVVNSLISDGKSNWFEGAMLCGIYIIIAISFFVIK